MKAECWSLCPGQQVFIIRTKRLHGEYLIVICLEYDWYYFNYFLNKCVRIPFLFLLKLSLILTLEGYEVNVMIGESH